MESKSIIIIGGGPAGLEASYNLALNGYKVTILEKETEIGGNIRKWVKLFPDFGDAAEVRKAFADKVNHGNIDIVTGVEISKLYFENGKWIAKNGSEIIYSGDAALLSTGFEAFDAKRKEELGYGIYPNVITSVDFEEMYKKGKILTAQGTVANRIAFLNCVGSRDEKVGNHYCSRVCCINAVKQATEFKELYPNSEAYCFYMDMRMAGQFYEELYRKSQEKHNVNYIRGRISEAAATFDNRVQIKSEDTLSGLPLKMTVDILVLMVGIESSKATTELSDQNGIKGEYGFAKSLGLHGSDNLTKKDGLFLAGSCKRPLTLPETIADARAATLQILNYLTKN
jgi:heterodisulfide reductase subunit A